MLLFQEAGPNKAYLIDTMARYICFIITLDISRIGTARNMPTIPKKIPPNHRVSII